MSDQTVVTLLTIFVPITGLAVILQASVLLGILLTVRKALNRTRAEADELRTKLIPVLDHSKEMMDAVKDLVGGVKTLLGTIGPRLQSAAGELETMAQDLHAQQQRLQASVDDVTLKARRQVDRVDGMTTSVLDSLDRMGVRINDALRVPVRQVNGIVAAARAVVETLRSPAPPRARRPAPNGPVSPGAYEPDDKDLFV